MSNLKQRWTAKVLKKLMPHERKFANLSVILAAVSFFNLFVPWNPGKYIGLTAWSFAVEFGLISITLRRHERKQRTDPKQ